jgi:hypothetical protein
MFQRSHEQASVVRRPQQNFYGVNRVTVSSELLSAVYHIALNLTSFTDVYSAGSKIPLNKFRGESGPFEQISAGNWTHLNKPYPCEQISAGYQTPLSKLSLGI